MQEQEESKNSAVVRVSSAIVSPDGVLPKHSEWLLTNKGTDIPRGAGTYFIFWPHFPYAVKVGFSAQSIEARLKQYFSHCPCELRMLAYFDGTDVEKAYHHDYRLQRIDGTEWFWLDDEIRASLEGVVSAFRDGLLSQTHVRNRAATDTNVTDQQFPHVMRALQGKAVPRHSERQLRHVILS